MVPGEDTEGVTSRDGVHTAAKGGRPRPVGDAASELQPFSVMRVGGRKPDQFRVDRTGDGVPDDRLEIDDYGAAAPGMSVSWISR